jgi:hypothetical protein
MGMRIKIGGKDMFCNADLKISEDIKVLEALKGKTIMDVGFIQEKAEGGLTLDYKDGEKIKRIVLGYNELGMWIVWQGVKGEINPEDKLKEKIINCENIGDEELDMIDDPLKRCYRFMNGSKEIFCLTCSEIKLLPENIRKYFQLKGEERTKEAEKDLDEVWSIPGLDGKLTSHSLSPTGKVAAIIMYSLGCWAFE